MKKITIIVIFCMINLFYANRANCQINQFAFDSLNRLVSINSYNGDKILYSYDDVGNRISTTITHPTSKSWIGVIDENWDKPGNWSPFGIPQTSDDATIPASAPFMPVVKIQGLSCHNVLIKNGAVITIQTGITFNITGSLSLEGP